MECNKIVDELNKAAYIQSRLIPKSYKDEKISMDGIYMPYEFLGGDLYHWEKINDHTYGVIILDVMGHGIATSMISMYIKSLLPFMMEYIKEPLKVMEWLNKVVIDLNEKLKDGGYHVTGIYLLVDTEKKRIKYINAAHPCGIVMDKDQNMVKMDKGGIPLGIFEDFQYEMGEIIIEKNSSIFLYTDGIFEILKENGLDIDYLINYVKYYGVQDIGTKATLDKMGALVEILPRTDDVSMIYMEINGE